MIAKDYYSGRSWLVWAVGGMYYVLMVDTLMLCASLVRGERSDDAHHCLAMDSFSNFAFEQGLLDSFSWWKFYMVKIVALYFGLEWIDFCSDRFPFLLDCRGFISVDDISNLKNVLEDWRCFFFFLTSKTSLLIHSSLFV